MTQPLSAQEHKVPKAEFEFGKTMIFVKKLTCVPCLVVLHLTTLDPSLKEVCATAERVLRL